MSPGSRATALAAALLLLGIVPAGCRRGTPPPTDEAATAEQPGAGDEDAGAVPPVDQESDQYPSD